MTAATCLHTITVELLDAETRRAANLRQDPNHLAIVERVNGNLVGVCATTSDYHRGVSSARSFAKTYGATLTEHAPTKQAWEREMDALRWGRAWV